MREETKKALEEMQAIGRKVDELCIWVEADSGKSAYIDADALAEALEKEKEAQTRYHTLSWEDMGQTQGWIDAWLKKAKLK